MDSITQVALGAAIGDAAFGRKLGKKAVLFGGACGLLPDLDMFVSLFGDEWTTLVHHRAFSHSLLVLPFVVPLVAWLGWRWDGKRNPYLVWMHLAFWSLCTHPVLDWFTSYGTVLFVPATWHRYANDGVFIIDPIYSGPLFVALVWSWRRRKRGGPSPGGPLPDGNPHGVRAALARVRAFLAGLKGWQITAAALAFTTAYLLFGLGVTGYAESIAREELEDWGFEPVGVRAMPMAFFPLLRRVVARDAEGTIMAGAVSLWARRPIRFTWFELPDDPLVEKALESEEGETLSWFADGYVAARVERVEGVEQDKETGGATVYLIDQRYGFLTNPAASPFSARFVFGADGRLESAAPLHEGFELSFGEEISAMWRLTWGTDG